MTTEMVLKTTDAAGNDVGSVTLDAQLLGGKVKNRLIHAAAVMYHNNLRQGSHATKSRGMIAGSTKKLYRQKGTGRARMGTAKSGIRRSGGVIHGPQPRNFVYHMPRKQRQAALRSALLAKAKDDELHVVTSIDLEAPKTKAVVELLNKHELGGEAVLIATNGLKRNVYLSGRNIPGVRVIPARELNARHLLSFTHVLIEEAALEPFKSRPASGREGKHTRKPKGTRKKQQAAEAAAAPADEGGQ